QEEGVCVEYTEKFDRAEPEKLLKVIEVIKKSTARVIVGFLSHVEMNNLLEQLSLHNITGHQFIGVEAWITADSLVTPTSFSVLGGALGFAVQKANISGLEDFLVVEALKHVNFTIKNGESVWFDNTGAAVNRYELVNWQLGSDGSILFKPVGHYDASLPSDKGYLCRFAVKAVIQEPIKSFKRESMCAALTVCRVQLESLATR
ncbi:hypothetical protein CCH79_00021117, partial [Gambusia affinis]